MNVLVRLTALLHGNLREDLRRPHAFAAERVAFAFGRQGATPEGPIIVLTSFEPVADDDYEYDPRVGARIGAVAINKALRMAASLGAAAFHVHAHEHYGTLWFSRTDLQELPPVMQPFKHIVPNQPRGMLLLGDNDDCVGLMWVPGDDEPQVVSDVTIVGTPMKLRRRTQ